MKVYRQAVWNQFRVLLQEQSELGLHCLTVRRLKRFNRRKNLVYVVVISAKFMMEVGIWHRVIIFQEIDLIKV